MRLRRPSLLFTSFCKRMPSASFAKCTVYAALFMLLNQPDPSFAEKKLDRLQADTKQLGRVIGSLIKREDFAAVEQMLAQARNGDVARGIYLYRSAERQDAELVANTQNVQGFVPQPAWQEQAKIEGDFLVVSHIVSLSAERKALLIYVEQLAIKPQWPFAAAFCPFASFHLMPNRL